MQSWLCEKQRIVRTWSSITSTVMRLKYSLAIHTRVTNNTFHSETAICWIFCRLNKFERKFLRNRCKKYDSRRKIKYIETMWKKKKQRSFCQNIFSRRNGYKIENMIEKKFRKDIRYYFINELVVEEILENEYSKGRFQRIL